MFQIDSSKRSKASGQPIGNNVQYSQPQGNDNQDYYTEMSSCPIQSSYS